MKLNKTEFDFLKDETSLFFKRNEFGCDYKIDLNLFAPLFYLLNQKNYNKKTVSDIEKTASILYILKKVFYSTIQSKTPSLTIKVGQLTYSDVELIKYHPISKIQLLRLVHSKCFKARLSNSFRKYSKNDNKMHIAKNQIIENKKNKFNNKITIPIGSLKASLKKINDLEHKFIRSQNNNNYDFHQNGLYWFGSYISMFAPESGRNLLINIFNKLISNISPIQSDYFVPNNIGLISFKKSNLIKLLNFTDPYFYLSPQINALLANYISIDDESNISRLEYRLKQEQYHLNIMKDIAGVDFYNIELIDASLEKIDVFKEKKFLNENIIVHKLDLNFKLSERNLIKI